MHINCPHCQNPIEVVESADVKDVSCPSCGSVISLSDLRTRTETQTEPPMPKIGRFTLTEWLGEGGFGTVWRARDMELGRDVAVKLPRKDVLGGAEFEERFMREARAAANLKHDGIVTVHEVGRQDGTIYIVSDFVHGVNLAEWLTAQRPDPRQAAELIAQIAEALGHAHRQGVVHRDIKPANIMLRMADGSQIADLATLRPVVMDFGLAKREAAEVAITRDGRHLGTPAYMSPEQARGESHAADARSDVWSLGVMLYELLTGERPFRGAERMILLQILQDEPRPPRRLNDSIPRDLETITLKCLAKDPDRRYQSASDLFAELRRFLAGEPIHARPISAPERLWRWSKRNPRVAALSAAVFLLLLTVAIGSTTGIFLINEQKRQAETARDAEQAERQRAESERARADANAADAQAAQVMAEQRRKEADDNAELAAQRENEANANANVAEQQRKRAEENAKLAEQLRMKADENARLAEKRRIQADENAKLAEQRRIQADESAKLALRRLYTADMNLAQVAWENARVDRVLELLEQHGPESPSVDLRGFEWFYWHRLCHSDLRTLRGHKGSVSRIAFSPEGKRLASVSDDGTLKLWDVATGTELRTLGITIDPFFSSLSFSPNGEWVTWAGSSRPPTPPGWSDRELAALDADGQSVKLWHMSNGQEIRTLKGHTGWVVRVAFSPDGERLASASEDRTVKLWNLTTGQELFALKGHSGAVRELAYSTDGQRLVSASGDQIKLWNAMTGQDLRTFTLKNNDPLES